MFDCNLSLVHSETEYLQISFGAVQTFKSALNCSERSVYNLKCSSMGQIILKLCWGFWAVNWSHHPLSQRVPVIPWETWCKKVFLLCSFLGKYEIYTSPSSHPSSVSCICLLRLELCRISVSLRPPGQLVSALSNSPWALQTNWQPTEWNPFLFTYDKSSMVGALIVT